jgi:urease accessory protein
MRTYLSPGRLAFALAVLAASPAAAHVGAGAVSGFSSGFTHPLFGADHLLAMVTVGLWAGLVGGRALWAWPLAFVAVMLGGGVLGMTGVSLPFVEPAILASVIVLGATAALAVRAPVPVGAALVGGFALFHGHAHGTEIPAAAAGLDYLGGFTLATVLLLGAGVALGTGSTRAGISAVLVRALGASAAAVGVVLAAG